MFGLSWNGKRVDPKRLETLETEMLELRKQLRATLAEVSDLSERCYRFMKKAEARSRRELDGSPNQEPKPGERAAATPVQSSSRRDLWGARRRRMLRPAPVVNGADVEEEDGVSP